MNAPARHLPDEARVWKELAQIADPEIPVLTLVDMNVIRHLVVENDRATVVISPTFVGCPAMDLIRDEIRSRLTALGISTVDIKTTFSPPWSTAMLTEEVREKLRSFGIAPPPPLQSDLLTTLSLPVACPYCGAEHTTLENPFGSTLCKQIFYCESCRQSFERFKPL